MTKKKLKTIDLFCGCGGLTAGFAAAGFKNLAGYDNWQPAIDNYNANLSDHAYMLDLSDMMAAMEEFKQYYDKIDGIIGGPPCQDFSSAGKRVEGDRADLTIKYAMIVDMIRPKFFVMENVPRSEKANSYQVAMGILHKAHYGISRRVIDASKVGVPQTRKRLITVGVYGNNYDDKLGQMLEEGMSSHQTTMREYFGDELKTEYIYRHPRTYARRGVFSVDEPCPTIRGVNRPIPPGYPGHPGDPAPVNKARPLTTEERARVQTFEGWTWSGSKADLEQMIGNAVPVKLAEFIARTISAYLEELRKEA